MIRSSSRSTGRAWNWRWNARIPTAGCGSHRLDGRGKGEKASALTKGLPRPQNKHRLVFPRCARMAELADALASGASGLTVVEVRVLFRAPNFQKVHVDEFALRRGVRSSRQFRASLEN